MLFQSILLLCKLLLLQQITASVPGCCRKGRANELLPITVGSFVPGVGLNDELLSSQAQTTPEDDGRLKKKLNQRSQRTSQDM